MTRRAQPAEATRRPDQVTASDTERGQRVDDVVNRAKRSMRAGGGFSEATKVQPDSVAYGGQRGPLRVPHAAIGDTGMDEDHGQFGGRTGAFVCDAGR